MNEQNHRPITPPYRIETDRFVIRCYHPKDAPILRKSVIESVEELKPWLPWAWLEPQTVEERMEFIRFRRSQFDRDEDFVYGIFDKEETEVLGGTGLHTRRGKDAFEIGYWVNTNHARKGIATEASVAMTIIGLGYCKRDRIEVRCDVENKVSAMIPERLGFTKEAVRRRIDKDVDGTFRDTAIYTLFLHEFSDWAHRGLPLRGYDAAGRKVIG
ncbi:MAG: GNAT family protein [Bacteroidota bacterium]